MKCLLGRSPLGPEKLVRFEFLLQLIKDYLDPGLTFLSTLYTRSASNSRMHSPNPTPYAPLLAQLAFNSRDFVFTTNFDLNIESAFQASRDKALTHSSRKATSTALRAVSHLRDFNSALRSGNRRLLFKLHGSVSEPETLAATYDSVAPEARKSGDPRLALLSQALSCCDLCVVGYSGFDDMDIVPTLLAVAAPDREVHWFHHCDPAKPRAYGVRTFLRNVATVDPDALAMKKPVVPILNSWLDSGSRVASRITVHCGQTESMLSAFLLTRLNPNTVPAAVHDLRSRPSTRLRGRAEHAANAVKAWYDHLPHRSKHALALCAAIEAACQHEASTRVLHRLGRQLNELTRLPRGHCEAASAALRIVALAKLAQSEYWQDRAHHVEDLAASGENLIQALTIRRPDRSQTSIDPALVTVAAAELRQWHAESLRFKGELTEALNLLWTTHNKSPSLLYRSLITSGNFRPECCVRPRTWSRFAMLSASAWMTRGDIELGLEHHRKGRRSFEKALRLWSRIGNSYKRLYCAIGVADSYFLLGQLEDAHRRYTTLLRENIFSGWTQWMDSHSLVRLADLNRVRQVDRRKLAKSQPDLQNLLRYQPDPAIRQLAETLLWAFSWSAGKKPDYVGLERRYRRIRAWEWEDIDLLALEVLHIEFLLRAGWVPEAKERAIQVLRGARENSLPLLELRGRILLEEIRRLHGERVRWRDLRTRCLKRGFHLGAAYILAIALAAGERPLSEFQAAAEWASSNRLQWLSRFLHGGKSARQLRLPLAFPFSYA